MLRAIMTTRPTRIDHLFKTSHRLARTSSSRRLLLSGNSSNRGMRIQLETGRAQKPEGRGVTVETQRWKKPSAFLEFCDVVAVAVRGVRPQYPSICLPI